MSSAAVVSVPASPSGMPRLLRNAAWSLAQILGWQGLAGLALLVASPTWLAHSWATHERERVALSGQTANRAAHIERPINAGPQATEPPAFLIPKRADMPGMLALFASTARNNRLGWPGAEYRIAPATAARPASLEVRFTLKGPYPSLRHMLNELLARLPTAAVRDLAMSRPGSGSAEVEARLAVSVFIDDAEPRSAAGTIREPSR